MNHNGRQTAPQELPPWEAPPPPDDFEVPPDIAIPKPARTTSSRSGRKPELKLETNIPVEATLIWDTPAGPYQSQFGNAPARYLYTLRTAEGEQVLYVPEPVKLAIERLKLEPGDAFLIGKYKRAGERSERIEVERLSDTQTALDLKASIARAKKRPEPLAQPAKPAEEAPAADQRSDHPQPTTIRTKLEDALCTVVTACHAAAEHAKRIGFQMPPFSSEDIAKMAMTLTIESRNGGSR